MPVTRSVITAIDWVLESSAASTSRCSFPMFLLIRHDNNNATLKPQSYTYDVQTPALEHVENPARLSFLTALLSV